MNFEKELSHAFFLLHNSIVEEKCEELLTMPYAEFTLKCYITFHTNIQQTILRKGSPLEKAFFSLGIDQPHDQLSLLLSAFYLHLHIDKSQSY